MLRILRKRRQKIGVTYFGLLGHEVALLKTVVERDSDLAADYELRDPNDADSCGIVVVNKDSRLANSWWNVHKNRHPSAIPLFLTESSDPDESVSCKRPASPSSLYAAFRGLVTQELRHAS